MITENTLTDYNNELSSIGLSLVQNERGLSLTDGKLSLLADYSDMIPRLKQSNLQNEMLVKAVRIKGEPMPQKLLDATAGLGEDSLILAAAGFEVELYEFNKIIAALLADAIERAGQTDSLSHLVSNMTLKCQDSIKAMRNLSYQPDVVLLDPMFPARTKSALIKKKFQILQKLESPCSSEKELLEAAKLAHPRKIVVKRPVKGAYLADEKPNYSLTGKAVRYDCYLNFN